MSLKNKIDKKKKKETVSNENTPVVRKKPVNQLNDLTATQWIQETVSVFVQKGLGAGSKEAQIEKQHPAPFSFQDVARLITFFTKEGGLVLDPFSGVGSTLKACALNNRNGVGIEIVDKYVELTKQRLEIEVDNVYSYKNKQEVIKGDSLKEIKNIKDDYFDFIVTSPPYWSILNKKADHKVKNQRIANNLDTKYSEIKEDLGNIEKYEDFIDILSKFFIDCSRILKQKKYMCVIVSDFRDKNKYHMFHADLANKLEGNNFTLKGITVLYQRHKSIFPYGYPYSYVPNIHNQYILIFQNTKE